MADGFELRQGIVEIVQDPDIEFLFQIEEYLGHVDGVDAEVLDSIVHGEIAPLGTRGGGYVEVLEGVKDGEAVVVSANFLIDAESNLKAALRGLTQAEPPR